MANLSAIIAPTNVVTETSTQTLSNKTLTAPTITGDATINAQGDLRFADADSSNYVALQAPATVASNVTFTLPSADGTASQFLQTNGSGTLSFATVSGSSQWTTSGSNIYYNTGNATIGATTNYGKLAVIHGNTNPQNVNHSNAVDALVVGNTSSNNRVLITAVNPGDASYPSMGEMRLYVSPYNGTYGYHYNEAARFTTGGLFYLSGFTAGLSATSNTDLNIISNGVIQMIAKSDRMELRPTSGSYTILQQGNNYNNYKSAIVAQDISNYGRQYIYFASRNQSDTNSLNITTDTYFKFAEGSVYFPLVGTTGSGANAFLNSGSENQLLRSTSSLKYKTDVEILDSSYSQKIYQLKPIWYRSLAQADRKDWSWFGFGAEDVAEIEPRLVHYTYDEDQWETTTTPDPTDEYPDQVKTKRTLRVDAVGSPDGVMYDRLTVLLVQEMKNLRDELNTLKTELAILKGN